MLDYNTLLYKPITTKDDTESGKTQQMLDLLGKSIYTYEDEDMDWNALFKNMRPVVVKEEYIARPDLISLAIYGTDEFADLICKINGISNPFEMNEDMVLMLPDRTKLESMICRTGTECDKIEESDKQNTDTIATTDRGNKKLLNEKRSPNEATVNDVNYIIRKDLGLVFY